MIPNSTRSRKWFVPIAFASLLVCALCLIVILFQACSFNKYILAAGLPTPDRGYQTGTVFGYDVYIWNCYQGKHIVLYRESAEMRTSPYAREEVECGELTPIETKLTSEAKRDHDPRSFW